MPGAQRQEWSDCVPGRGAKFPVRHNRRVNPLPAPYPDEARIAAACTALARRLGLGPVQPVVIGRHSNLALRLDPLPWVARVATGTAGPRPGEVHALRELRLCQVLAAQGAPALRPAPPELAGPHLQDGWRMTLWPLLQVLPTAPDPRAAGAALARCHATLAESVPTAGMSAWAPLDEAMRLLAMPRVTHAAAPADLALVQARLDGLAQALHAHPAACQWLHGDAHLNNVVATAAGPCWLDWEDACTGPLEWDLAGLVAAARVLGSQRDWSELALAGWREQGPPIDEGVLAACIEARTLFVVAWSWWLGPQDPRRAARLQARLAWVRDKNPGLR